jgi:hypothetical protein
MTAQIKSIASFAPANNFADARIMEANTATEDKTDSVWKNTNPWIVGTVGVVLSGVSITVGVVVGWPYALAALLVSGFALLIILGPDVEPSKSVEEKIAECTPVAEKFTAFVKTVLAELPGATHQRKLELMADIERECAAVANSSLIENTKHGIDSVKNAIAVYKEASQKADSIDDNKEKTNLQKLADGRVQNICSNLNRLDTKIRAHLKVLNAIHKETVERG